MSKKEKLVKRFLSRPTDFTFDELATLLKSLGYLKETAGKTSGSRVTFSNQEGDYIRLHKPHPRNILKMYQIDDITANLKEKEKI
ncbi:MAG: type II toxin-antitoxin system HicA family toxin [Treponema sp.]|nr:type II toxin-antitoxin system HicA family toxin [Treponema sp.]